MKKILIFYGSYGGGHLSAAKAIKAYIEETYENKYEVEMIDCIEYINKYLNKISTEAYKEFAKKMPWIWKRIYNGANKGALSHLSNTTNKLLSRKLNQLIQEYNPDLIISTHPFSSSMVAMLKEKGKTKCKLATVMTDYHIHDQWLVLYKYVDHFFVSNEKMKTDMILKGIDGNKITVSGIPVSERFTKKYNKEKICKELDFNPEKETILFFAGGEFGLGRKTTFMVLRALIKLFKDIQVIAIAGKNPKMFNRFEKIVKMSKADDRVRVLKFTDKVPEYMSISKYVITKPGGLTVTECITSNKPIIIINPIPGQEEENADYLTDNSVAVWIKKEDNVARIFKNLHRNQDQFEVLRENTKKFSKPKATETICETLIKIL